MKNINKVVIGCFLVILLLNITMTYGIIAHAGVQPLVLEKVVSSTGGQAIELDEVGQISPGKTILDLEVIGSLAYFIEKDRGFAIYDVSNSSNCIMLDEYSLPHPHDLSIEGDHAIVMDPHIGVVILNITDTTHIDELGTYTNITNATHIHTVGDLVYIGDEANGLKVISTADPSNPVLLGDWQDSEGDVGDIYIIEEDYAFVGIHLPRYDAPPLSLGLKVLDISDPDNITPTCVVGDGNEYAGLAPSDHVGNLVYMGDLENGFKILDFTDPTNVTCIGNYFDGGEAHDVQIVNNHAFVADGFDGLEVIDISDPGNLVEITSHEQPWLTASLDVVDGLVYLGTIGGGIRIINLKTEPVNGTNGFEPLIIIAGLILLFALRRRRTRKQFKSLTSSSR